MPSDYRNTETPTPPDDKYARGSFTFRRMKSWQITTMVIVVILFLILGYWWLA